MLLDLRPWPFDGYQVFTSDARSTLVTWELRIQRHDGHEGPVDPEVYVRAFGSPGFTQDLAKRVAREADPERRRALSLALVRTIARHLPEATWREAQAFRTYVTRWRVQRPPPELLRREPLQDIPASSLRSGVEPTSSPGRR